MISGFETSADMHILRADYIVIIMTAELYFIVMCRLH
jgi:hypothetical protein